MSYRDYLCPICGARLYMMDGKTGAEIAAEEAWEDAMDIAREQDAAQREDDDDDD
jgi:transcription elongation factor Elf1